MPEPSEPVPAFEVIPREASYWWRSNDLAGTVLHRLMLLFIFVPVVLVYYEYYLSSFLVFCGMVPYGLLLQHLARRTVVRIIRKHPETLGHFADEGVIEL